MHGLPPVLPALFAPDPCHPEPSVTPAWVISAEPKPSRTPARRYTHDSLTGQNHHPGGWWIRRGPGPDRPAGFLRCRLKGLRIPAHQQPERVQQQANHNELGAKVSDSPTRPWQSGSNKCQKEKNQGIDKGTDQR